MVDCFCIVKGRNNANKICDRIRLHKSEDSHFSLSYCDNYYTIRGDFLENDFKKLDLNKSFSIVETYYKRK